MDAPLQRGAPQGVAQPGAEGHPWAGTGRRQQATAPCSLQQWDQVERCPKQHDSCSDDMSTCSTILHTMAETALGQA